MFLSRKLFMTAKNDTVSEITRLLNATLRSNGTSSFSVSLSKPSGTNRLALVMGACGDASSGTVNSLSLTLGGRPPSYYIQTPLPISFNTTKRCIAVWEEDDIALASGFNLQCTLSGYNFNTFSCAFALSVYDNVEQLSNYTAASTPDNVVITAGHPAENRVYVTGGFGISNTDTATPITVSSNLTNIATNTATRATISAWDTVNSSTLKGNLQFISDTEGSTYQFSMPIRYDRIGQYVVKLKPA